jgi:serine/threonine protein kinase
MRPQLTWATRKRMMKDATLGLHHLHSNRIVHLNIKPANFFVTEHLSVKIGDFGFTKRFDRSLSPASHAHVASAAAPTHSAPETLNGMGSYPADVYSFALVLYELMTLRGPWVADDTGIVADPWTLPLRVQQGFRPSLPVGMPSDHRALLEWSWHGDPTKRATMNDIILAIDHLTDIPEAGAASPVAVAPPLLRPITMDPTEELKRITQLLRDEQRSSATLREAETQTRQQRDQLITKCQLHEVLVMELEKKSRTFQQQITLLQQRYDDLQRDHIRLANENATLRHQQHHHPQHHQQAAIAPIAAIVPVLPPPSAIPIPIGDPFVPSPPSYSLVMAAPSPGPPPLVAVVAAAPVPASSPPAAGAAVAAAKVSFRFYEFPEVASLRTPISGEGQPRLE